MTSRSLFRLRTRHNRGDGLERLVAGLLAGMDHGSSAEQTSALKGLLQGLDPRVKLLGLLALIIATVSASTLSVIYGLLALSILLAVASRVPLRGALVRVWLGVLLFTGLMALPALVLVAGTPLLSLPVVGWVVTQQGLQSFGYVVGRGLACASLAMLLVLTTPWPLVLKALRACGSPAVFIAILNMCHRYLFLLLHSAQELLLANRSRLPVRPGQAQTWRLAITSLSALLERSLALSQEVHLAMIARGYRGQDLILQELSLTRRDGVMGLFFMLAAGLAFWFGR